MEKAHIREAFTESSGGFHRVGSQAAIASVVNLIYVCVCVCDGGGKDLGCFPGI